MPGHDLDFVNSLFAAENTMGREYDGIRGFIAQAFSAPPNEQEEKSLAALEAFVDLLTRNKAAQLDEKGLRLAVDFAKRLPGKVVRSHPNIRIQKLGEKGLGFTLEAHGKLQQEVALERRADHGWTTHAHARPPQQKHAGPQMAAKPARPWWKFFRPR